MEKITSEMVKELRERTGVGMSKCKDALVRAEGNVEGAIEILRKEGMASAVKKEAREAKEGIIKVGETQDAIAMVEVNAETDFVIQNMKFQNFAEELAQLAVNVKPQALDQFLHLPHVADPSMTVDQYRSLLIQTFGENLQISRVISITKRPDCSYGIYCHMGGKIVSIVEIESVHVEEIAKDVAMHVAAESPEYLVSQDIPQEVIKSEEEIARSQIKDKPESVIPKIISGKLKAFYDQVCLLSQRFVKDPSVTIEQFIKYQSKSLGKSLKILRFWRWQVGQK